MNTESDSVIERNLFGEELTTTTVGKLENLPPRLLGRILAYIPRDEHSGLKEVSQTWERLIDEHIGVPVYIGQNSDYKNDRIEYCSVDLMTQLGISILHLVNLHNTILPDFKFPNLVKEITFTDYISERNFLRALTQLTNLRVLTIDMSTCHYLEFNSISLEFLTRLETLTFHSGEYCSEWNEEIHPSRNEVKITLENFFSLLTGSRFRNLKNLLIGFPYVTPAAANVQFTTSLFKCLITHAETLRHLEVLLDGKLDNMGSTDTPPLEIDYTALTSVKLQDMFVNLHNYQQELNILEPWLRLLNMQKNLQRCIFIPRGGDEEECVELPLPEDLLLNSPSSSTLTVFKWFLSEAQDGSPSSAVDCASFQKCALLADINLTSSSENPSKIINMALLPVTLQRVCFEGIQCQTSDIEILVTEFPALRKLTLTTIGEEGNFGMNVDTLRGIYEKRIITKLLVMDGFNKSSIRAASQDEESSFSFLILLLKTKFYDGDAYFHMKLCDKGEYAVIQ